MTTLRLDAAMRRRSSANAFKSPLSNQTRRIRATVSSQTPRSDWLALSSFSRHSHLKLFVLFFRFSPQCSHSL